MSTHTRTKHRLGRHHVTGGAARSILTKANRHRAAAERSAATLEFVRRTTTASGVPLVVEDDGAIEQIARVMS
jgi:hypothetical protein